MVFLFSGALAWCQVPGLMSYQGYLTDKDTGEGLNGDYNITFTFYDGASTVRTVGPVTVPVDKGLFKVVLGSGDATDNNQPLATNIWNAGYTVGITIGTAAELPKVNLTSVPYAFTAEKALSMNAAGLSGTVSDARLESTVDLGALTVGSSKFSVDGNGNITKINNVSYSFPSTQGGTNSFLNNDGSGMLSWSPAVTSLNALTGSVTLSAGSNMTITPSGNTLTLSTAGSGISGSGTLNQLSIWGGTSSLASSADLVWDNTNSRLGVKKGVPTATVDVAGSVAAGTSSQFVVNASGDLVKVNDVTYSFPSSQGGSGSFLTNDASGNLSWTTALNATNIGAGTLSDSRLETNVDIGGYLTTVNGLHIGGSADPGSSLVVDNDATIAGALSTGSSSQFHVNSSGNITKLNNVTTSFPSAQGATGSFLANNGSGTLSWTATLNADNISSGTLSDSRLEADVDVAGHLTTVDGLHVGGSSDPGSDLVVDNGATITGSLSTGSSSQFAVDASGNITKINDIAYSFPASQGGASSLLSNNGSGTLVWTSGISAGILTTGMIANSLLDSDLQDLADGTLSDSRLESTIDRTIFNASDYITAAGGVYVGSSPSDPLNNLVVNGANAGFGETSPTFPVDIKTTVGTTALRINKTGAAALQELVVFSRNGVSIGNITSNASDVVSYNGFVGSHYALSAERNLEYGELVTMSGVNGTLNDMVDGEPIYSVMRAQQANDPKVLGTYFCDAHMTRDDEPIKLIMSVGNGKMWVVDTGEDIETGEYLVSSGVAGHAMKDNESLEISNVIARAAEAVNWSEVSSVVNGTKHKLINVFFENFVVDRRATRLVQEVDYLRGTVTELQAELNEMKMYLNLQSKQK